MKPNTRSRLLLALAALVMVPVFFTPLWSIQLRAPQYPEGLGMHILVHDVQGHDRHDLQNINILNHYIGMQPIEPEEIPELRIMPVILGALIVTGLLAALVGRPWLMAAWLVVFLGLGVAGMVDFYLWNIEYGHNLSPDAPIRIPDMTYSPPIIGTKQILNIRASSFPHLGAGFLTLAALLSALAVSLGFRGRREDEAGAPRSKGSAGLAVVALAAGVWVLGGCSGEEGAAYRAGESPGSGAAVVPDVPAEDRMVYGESEDPYCGELVEKVRWGGEIRTTDGTVHRFRSVECLAAFLLGSGIPSQEVAQVRVVDFPHGWKLIDPAEATFLRSPNLASPTRLNLLAIEADKMVVNLQAAYTGEVMEWEQVLALVDREWAPRVARTGGGG